MRKIIFILTILIIALASCVDNDKNEGFVIYGEVENDSCNGAKIYLVPMTEPATHETVDSVVIVDRKFTFHGTTKRVAVLRLQMPQRFSYQELLLLTEPGIIQAKIARKGSVTGTRSNDLLQEWKETMESCAEIRNTKFVVNNRDYNSPAYRRVADSLGLIVKDANLKIIRSMGFNPLSCYLYRCKRGNFPEGCESELQNYEDDFQLYVDSIRKVRAAENKEQNQ